MKIPTIKYFLSSPKGLKPLAKLSPRYHNKQIARTLIETDPTRFSEELFYLYGWSGALSTDARLKAAKNLAHALEKLLALYSQPYLRIIAHSHGGNVALELGAIANITIKVDELILLACPVQEETKHYVASSVFKRIYSIHSHRDFIQVLDPQGLHHFWSRYRRAGFWGCLNQALCLTPLFSGRHFPPSPNLLQIHFTLNRRNLLHIEFLFLKFYRALPAILDQIQKQTFKENSPDVLINIRI